MADRMEERIRKRIPKSCRRCHRRKQRCVGALVWANCELAGQPCVRSDSVPSWHHGMSKGALAQRIETLEAQLAALAEGRTGHATVSRSEDHPQSSKETRSPGVAPGRYEDKVEGNYLGPSSGLAIAKNISRIVQDAVWKSIAGNETHEFQAPCENEITVPASAPDDAMGARLLEAYFKSMQMRLPFLCRAESYELHARRHEPVGSSTAEQSARFKILMVYAIGAAILRMTEMYDATPTRNYFVTAKQYQPAIQGSLSITSIEALMILAMYNLQSSASLSVWYMMGLETRICVDFGLHREVQYPQLTPYVAQRRRRLFWSVYLNERSVADPADVDDSLSEIADEELFRTPRDPGEQWTGPNIRCFIAIRASVYRLDRDLPSLLHEAHPLLMLDEYQKSLPCLSAYENDFIQMHWNNAKRTLLHPFLSILPPDDESARHCLYSSGQLCQYFKILRQRYSTYLCLFRSPRLWTISVSNDLRACSSTLFVMAERHPSVRKYRDALETAIDRVMDYGNDAEMQSQPHTAGGMSYTLDRTLTDPPTPEFYIASPQASRASAAGVGMCEETPETIPISLSDGRATTFSGLFTEDFWVGDAFSLHMEESFGLRT
ncbi:fungal-specific transcription factor domain-containing protein [Aspergillus falconensis]